MSDNILILIPDDYNFIPNDSQQKSIKDILFNIINDTDNIKLNITDKIIFHDCGENFEQIICPSCSAEISMDWFGEHMNKDYNEGGFLMDTYTTSCCGIAITLQDLVFKGVQGFAKFTIEIWNTEYDNLIIREIDKFEKILDTKLRIISRRI
jgi:hypothetical protein